jgi:hypothetical protein
VQLVTATFLRILTFVKIIYGNHLHIPGSRPLPNDDFCTSVPFVNAGDEASALSQRVLRTYSSRNLDISRRIYNYRLTWSRRMVECAFGIL